MKLPPPLPGRFPFAIAGFSYHDGPKELSRLAVGDRLTLRAEPDNPHDPFAVEILHGWAKLGYIPRFCNGQISRLLQAGVPVACEIARVDPQAPTQRRSASLPGRPLNYAQMQSGSILMAAFNNRGSVDVGTLNCA